MPSRVGELTEGRPVRHTHTQGTPCQCPRCQALDALDAKPNPEGFNADREITGNKP